MANHNRGNLKQFTLKSKPVIYTGTFVELYNRMNHGQVHKIYGIIGLERMCASTIENHRNLSTHHMIEISLVLYSAYIVPKDQDKFVFYINYYID